MKIKQTILLAAVIGISGLFATPLVSAKTSCGSTATSIIGCNPTNANGVEGTAVWSLLLIAINILTAGVGIVAVAGIIYGSIMYATSGGSPENVKKARTIITNVVIGIIAYAFMFTILNFITPGGLFN
jgi:hypothetical protein